MGEAVQRLTALGGELVPGFDFAPFAETAVLLYGAAFVAERYAGRPAGSRAALSLGRSIRRLLYCCRGLGRPRRPPGFPGRLLAAPACG